MTNPGSSSDILVLGHSLIVPANRALARAVGASVVAAPARFRGDYGPLVCEARPDEPFETVPLPVVVGRSGHALLYRPGPLRRLLRSRRWSAVAAWVEPYTLSAGQVAWSMPKDIPLVFATFQNIAKTYPPPWRWIEREAMRRADGWVAFAEGVRRTLEGRPVYRDKPHRVIPLGIDTSKFFPDSRPAGALPVIGYLGRFVEEKGLHDLVDALARLDPLRPCRAVLIGSGPLEEELKGRVWDLPIPAEVRPPVEPEKVPQVLRGFDILVLPSRTTPRWREQLGRVAIEAMASGLAVVGTDSGEIPAVLGDAGVIVPERSPSALADALASLIANPERRRELGRKARARAETVFGWDAIGGRWRSFLNELSNRR